MKEVNIDPDDKRYWSGMTLPRALIAPFFRTVEACSRTPIKHQKSPPIAGRETA
ncbi:MAG: hypothetical protein ACK5LK_10620 [Chthoniobacterales bacterium]